jgi:hypothetical protein
MGRSPSASPCGRSGTRSRPRAGARPGRWCRPRCHRRACAGSRRRRRTCPGTPGTPISLLCAICQPAPRMPAHPGRGGAHADAPPGALFPRTAPRPCRRLRRRHPRTPPHRSSHFRPLEDGAIRSNSDEHTEPEAARARQGRAHRPRRRRGLGTRPWQRCVGCAVSGSALRSHALLPRAGCDEDHQARPAGPLQ